MAQLTKQALIVENNQSFPNNNVGAITPTILREFNTDIIDSTVNQTVYTADSASWNQQIDAIEASTGSAMITGSVNGSILTFTKANGSTFNLAITASVGSVAWDNVTGKPSGLVSGSSQVLDILTSVNSFTASQETKDSTLATYTGSVDTKFTTIGSQSGSWINTALNTFTQSQESKDSTLATYTGSIDTKFTTLGSQSGSWVTETESGSFLITASFDNGTRNLTFTKGNSTTFAVTIPDASGSAPINTGSFATTGSNTFNGSQNIIGAVTASTARIANLNYPTADNGEKSFVQTDGNGNLSLQYVDTIFEAFYAGQSVPKGTPLYFSGSQGANPIAYAADASIPAKMPVVVVANVNLTAGTTYEGIVLGLIEGLDLTGYTAGQTVYVAEGGGWSTSLPSGSNSITQVLGVVTKGGIGGKGLVLNPGPAQLPGLQTGYAWVGNSGNQPIAVATSSFAENTNLGPLNAFTASQEGKDSTLATYTGSIDTKFSTIGGQSGSWDNTSLNSFTSSQQVLNAKFATTGSNNFIGNQTITGVSKQTFTAPGDNSQTDIVTINGANTSGKAYNYVNFGFVDYGGSGANYDDSFAFECYDSTFYNYGSELTINGRRIDFGLNASGSARPGKFSMRDQYDGTTFTNLYADDMQLGEFAGGTNNRIGIGHIALPTLQLKAQNISVTGSLTISGSINTSVIPLTITSNTASLNASSGSAFQLNLVSGSATILEITGTKSGQTINLLVSQSATGPGTLVFGAGIEQPSGSFYSASQVANGEDILTMATFINASRIYVANVKNFI